MFRFNRITVPIAVLLFGAGLAVTGVMGSASAATANGGVISSCDDQPDTSSPGVYACYDGNGKALYTYNDGKNVAVTDDLQSYCEAVPLSNPLCQEFLLYPQNNVQFYSPDDTGSNDDVTDDPGWNDSDTWSSDDYNAGYDDGYFDGSDNGSFYGPDDQQTPEQAVNPVLVVLVSVLGTIVAMAVIYVIIIVRVGDNSAFTPLFKRPLYALGISTPKK